jgi:small subunit ribosomal protein S7
MSRRHRAEKRETLPDPRFGDKILARFINLLMQDGKKSTAERIAYGALELVRQREKLKDDQAILTYFHEALDKIKPQLEVRSRRVGGATYQVPMEVRPERRLSLAIRWIVEAARKRSENTMVERLAGELVDIMNDRGSSVKKRDDTHKMAEANKAFAHYRW